MSHRLRLETARDATFCSLTACASRALVAATAVVKVAKNSCPSLLELLTVLHGLLKAVQKELEATTKRIQEAATPQPHGVGALTSQVLEREILDWSRFQNRRQVASLTGMCPGVHASGGRSRSGPITKHGNRRIRTALIELAWRTVRFQPDYPPLKRWQPVLIDTRATGAQKKKAIVALGRKLAIDLWRINTNRSTAAKLGLK